LVGQLSVFLHFKVGNWMSGVTLIMLNRWLIFFLPIFLDLQNPNEVEDWLGDFNTKSKEVITSAYAVPPLANAKVGDRFQFERLGGTCRLGWIWLSYFSFNMHSVHIQHFVFVVLILVLWYSFCCGTDLVPGRLLALLGCLRWTELCAGNPLIVVCGGCRISLQFAWFLFLFVQGECFVSK
jgi:hypothetical protein